MQVGMASLYSRVNSCCGVSWPRNNALSTMDLILSGSIRWDACSGSAILNGHADGRCSEDERKQPQAELLANSARV